MRDRRTEARAILSELEREAARRYISSYPIGVAWLAVGDRMRAIKWLERARTNRDYGVILMRTDPALNPLRTDPRFVRLLRLIVS